MQLWITFQGFMALPYCADFNLLLRSRMAIIMTLNPQLVKCAIQQQKIIGRQFFKLYTTNSDNANESWKLQCEYLV